MKYMAIVYGYGDKQMWESFPPEVAAKAIGEVDAFNRHYTESGELLGAFGLADELMAKTVRVRDGIPAVTDGPYLEAKEFASSFWILDTESEKQALEIVAGRPFAAANAVEVWPILHEPAGSWPADPRAPTSSRPPSPRATTRPLAPRRPTGRRFSPFTGSA